MNIFFALFAATLVFGLCYLVDRSFHAKFREQAPHGSGQAVRLNKRYASCGLILIVMGIISIFSSLSNGTVLLAGGIIVLLIGAGLTIYYITFGLYYDDDSFILANVGKKSRTYRFSDIRCQQLYLIQGGGTVVELHLSDGNAVGLQSGMEGVYPFLDHAFAAWCRQTGQEPEGCSFHDPANSLWFPSMEDV